MNTNVTNLFKTSHAALILNRFFRFVFMFLFMFVICKLPIIILCASFFKGSVFYDSDISETLEISCKGKENLVIFIFFYQRRVVRDVYL